LFLGHSELVEHFGAGFDHHGRPAEIKLDGFDVGVFFKVVDEDEFVDEAGESGPVVLFQRGGEGDVEGEVRVLRGELGEVVVVVDFLFGAGAIPIADFAVGAFVFQEMGEVGARAGEPSCR
jgi:hypothetical protein